MANIPDNEALDALARIISLASEKSLVCALEALAKQTGHEQIDGVPIREFYFREREREMEKQIADFADTHMAYASELKRLYDMWKRGEGVFS